MKYYYINTNVKEMGYSPHQIWFKEEYAFVSDSPGDETSLEQLKKLEPGDILFMYVNGSGVMATGKVCKPCNGCQYTGDERWIQKYAKEEYRDYSESRICVKWCTLDNPMSGADLKHTIGPPPPNALQRIVKHHKGAEQLHLKLKRKHTQNN